MPTTQRFFSNIKSTRDNGAEIELNLRGTYYFDPGKYHGPYEHSYQAEHEIHVTECHVIEERTGTNQVWATQVDFYDLFSETEQARFLELAEQEMEADD
mgnify:CR=1 FL=1